MVVYKSVFPARGGDPYVLLQRGKRHECLPRARG
jgi:hypothetical protein